MFDSSSLARLAAHTVPLQLLAARAQSQNNGEADVRFDITNARLEITGVRARKQSGIVNEQHKFRRSEADQLGMSILAARRLCGVKKLQPSSLHYRRWIRGESSAHQSIQYAGADSFRGCALDGANHFK